MREDYYRRFVQNDSKFSMELVTHEMVIPATCLDDNILEEIYEWADDNNVELDIASRVNKNNTIDTGIYIKDEKFRSYFLLKFSNINE